jgi:hypothetical protein
VPKPKPRYGKTNGMRKLDVSFHMPASPMSPTDWGIGGVPSLFYRFMRYYGYEHTYSSTNHIDIKAGGFISGNGDIRGILVNYYLIYLGYY